MEIVSGQKENDFARKICRKKHTASLPDRGRKRAEIKRNLWVAGMARADPRRTENREKNAGYSVQNRERRNILLTKEFFIVKNGVSASSFKVGDVLILFRNEGGQKYLIFDKKGAL